MIQTVLTSEAASGEEFEISMSSSPGSSQPAPAPLAELEISRQSRILSALFKKAIDLDKLRMLADQGVLDGAGVRSTVWKLLLGYLPNDRALWEQELAKKRSQFAAFKDEFLSNTVEIVRLEDQKATAMKMQSMSRMELCGSCRLRDNFCQKLDNSAVGIRGTLSKLSQLLAKYDGELQHHVEITTEVNPQFYAFRWITLMLTQEFNFADTIHTWDTLLSDPDGPQETLLRI